MRTSVITIAVALLAGACTNPASPAERARLSLDAAVIAPAASPSGAGVSVVQLTVRHAGGPAVALTGCPRPPAVRFERLEDGAWRDAGSVGIICLGIYSPTTAVVAAGGSLTSSLELLAPGRYRFAVLVGPDRADPERTLRSAEVVVPARQARIWRWEAASTGGR